METTSQEGSNAAGRKRRRPPPLHTPSGAGPSSRPAVVVDLTDLPDTPSDDEIKIVGEVRGARRPTMPPPAHRRRIEVVIYDEPAQLHHQPSAQQVPPQQPPQPPLLHPHLPASHPFNAPSARHLAVPFPAPPSPEAKGFKCSICMEHVEDTSSTSCGHVFCTKCVIASVKMYKKCPKCNKALKMSQIHKIYLDL